MNDAAPDISHSPEYPPGFRARRGLNWGFLGLLYTSFYMCRYNLSIANGSISKEFGFTRADMGVIITTSLLAYAFGQIINGLICDKIGGKRSMLIGAAGTVVMNFLFGAATYYGELNSKLSDTDHPLGQWRVHLTLFHVQIFFQLLTLFVAIRGIDGYMQAYGAPGMIKINTAWFSQRERGRFAGIFGFMINLGRFGIFKLGPALLAGFTFLWMWQVPPLHWRWLFWIPSGICAVVAVGMALTVKETPEAAGFHDTHAAEPKPATGQADMSSMELLIKLLSNPTIWIVALAYACTGSVRQSLDQWWPRFLTEVWKIDFNTEWHLYSLNNVGTDWYSRLLNWGSVWNAFSVIGCLIPLVASTGSLISGYLSDIVFKGRRAPVAAGIYFLETAIILLAAQCHSAGFAVFFVILISLTANSTHSLLGTAAAMDIGGRKQSGFASGVIDSFQYFGGSLAGYFLGMLLDKSWGYYFYFMAPFGLMGGLLMIFMMGKITPKAQAASSSVAATAPK